MNKIYCILLIIIFVVICLLPISASALDTVPWVRIINADTPLYTNANNTKITCMLHTSYYLYVLDTIGNYYLVELMDNTTGYPKIVGYVAIDSVEQCTNVPMLPYYPQCSVTVSTSSASIKLSPLDSASELICATNAQTMSYYGYIDVNTVRWYYVYFYGTFGYISSQYTLADNIPMHPTPLVEETIPEQPTPTDPDEPEDTVTTPTNTNKTTTSEILLIIFVCILSIGLVVALFTPKVRTNTACQAWDKHL